MNIHDGHDWGDDFAGYIKEAMNIAHGKPFYQSGYIYNKFNTEYAPPQYPPGFPLMLAPVVRFWGLSFPAMCYFNSVIASLLLFVLFAYFRKHAGVVPAICLALLVTYSGYMIDIKRSVLSDVPCLLFTTLYLAVRCSESFSLRRTVVLTLLMTCAVLIRTQSVLLIAAEGVYLFFFVVRNIVREKRFAAGWLTGPPSLPIIAGSVIGVLLFTHVFFKAPVSSDSFYGSFISVILHKPWLYLLETNITGLRSFLFLFFHYETHNTLVSFIIYSTECMALVFSIVGFLISVRRRLAVDDIFFMLICVMTLLLPIGGLRYFLPVIPILYLYCFRVLQLIRPAVTGVKGPVAAAVLTAGYLLAGSHQLLMAAKREPQFEMPMPNDWQALNYIRNHVSDSDIILFEKPRVLTLFTGKRCINTAWQLTQQRNKEVLDSIGVRYVLVLEGLGENYYWSYLKLYNTPPDSVRIGWGYTLYTLKK